MRLNLQIDVIQIGSRYVATADVAGFRLRAAPATSALGTVRGLFWMLSGNGPQTNGDEELALVLLLEDTTLQAELERQALPAPKEETR